MTTKVGKVSRYNAGSGQILLITFSEYPVVSKKLDDVESTQPDNSLYKEDGSVEIDFYSLVDVRIVKGGTSGPRNVAPSWVNGSPVGNENAPITVSSSSNDKQTVVPSQENKEAIDESGGVSAWGQFAETLNTNKEQLPEENNWDNSAKTVHSTWKNSWGKNANVVQPQHENSWGKNAKKVQPPRENSWGRQNLGRKSWSFKSSRGGAHGSTMSRWKNGN